MSVNRESAITPRKLQTKAQDVPRHWHNTPFATHFFNALGLTFPVGERYFVQAVRHFRKDVTDPKLSAELKGFISQELIHEKEHERFNELLLEHGYDASEIDRDFRKNIELGTKIRSPMTHLAHTVACEHLTASVGHVILSNPACLEGVRDDIKQLWLWHALEEVEHKAVAFDVFEAVGGSYWRRILAMLEITLVFPITLFAMIATFLHKDGLLFKRSTWRDARAFLFGEVGVLRQSIKAYWPFYRRDFHPWDEDDSHLIRETEARLSLMAQSQPVGIG